MIQRLRAGTPGGTDGFTLIETLIALVLLGFVVGVLASVTAQWLPNWKHGLARARVSEKAAIALDRLVTDLSAAQFVSVSRQGGGPLFSGDEHSVTFVRSAIGPNDSHGLEIVRVAEITDDVGPALVRMRAPFMPHGPDFPIGQIRFSEPVVLLRAPLHITFGFAGDDGKWLTKWPGAGALPTAVRFVVSSSDTHRTAVISPATRILVHLMAPRPDVVVDTPPTTASASLNANGTAQ